MSVVESLHQYICIPLSVSCGQFLLLDPNYRVQ